MGEEKDDDYSDLFEPEDPTSPESAQPAAAENEDVALVSRLVEMFGRELAEAILNGELPVAEIRELYRRRRWAAGSGSQQTAGAKAAPASAETRTWLPAKINLMYVYPAVYPNPKKIGLVEGEVGSPVKGAVPLRMKDFFIDFSQIGTRYAEEICNRVGHFWPQIDGELERNNYHGDSIKLRLHCLLYKPYLVDNIGEATWDQCREGLVPERQIDNKWIPQTSKLPQIEVDCLTSPPSVKIFISVLR